MMAQKYIERIERILLLSIIISVRVAGISTKETFVISISISIFDLHKVLQPNLANKHKKYLHQFMEILSTPHFQVACKHFFLFLYTFCSTVFLIEVILIFIWA